MTMTTLQQLIDFVRDKAESGKIQWDNDAPVFWGLVEEAENPLPHEHKMQAERGPYGCRGGTVRYVEICSCGCERHNCGCQQCIDQGTDTTLWKMPICDCCGKRHPLDQSC